MTLRHLVASIALIALTITLPAAHAQQARPQDAKVSASLRYGSFFVPGSWTPVRAELQNPTDTALQGELQIGAGLNHGNEAALLLPVQVPARSVVIAETFTYFPAQVSARLPVEWIVGGARQSRSDIIGQSIGDHGANGGLVLSINAGPEANEIFADPSAMSAAISSSGALALAVQTSEPEDLPFDVLMYDSIRVVLIDFSAAARVSPAQQQALLDFVRRGGVLLAARPVANLPLPPGSQWLNELLPVKVIGHRLADRLQLSDRLVPLKHNTPLDEAVLNSDLKDVAPLLADAHYVHAAWRPYGVGRIVFTSFGAGALAGSELENGQLFRSLLGLESLVRPDLGIQRSADKLVPQLIGMPAPSWNTAALITAGYVLAILGLQLFIGGVHRPRAFATATVVAIVGAIGLTAYAWTRQSSSTLTSGRIELLELTPQGGRQTEFVGLIGMDDEALSLATTDPGHSLRPVVNTASPRLLLQTDDGWLAQGAGVRAAKLEQIWSAQGQTSDEQSARAIGQFGPEGLTLQVSHSLNLPMDSALLVGPANWRVGQVPAEGGTLGLQGRTPPGDFVVSTGIPSEIDKARGRVLAAAFSSLEGTGIVVPQNRLYLAAWPVTQPGEPGVSPLLQVQSERPDEIRQQALVLMDVDLVASEPGSTVQIDGGFLKMVSTGLRVPPADPIKRQWVANSQSGQWLIGFEPPREIGLLRPTKAQLRLSLNAPAHVLKVQRAQIDPATGKPRPASSDEALVELNQFVGERAVTFDVGEQAYDQAGRVWIVLSVEAAGGPSMTNWHLQSFELDVEGEVIAAPAQTGDKPAGSPALN